MNPIAMRLANRVRGRIVASHLPERLTVKPQAAALPLPFVARWWPHVKRTAPGPLAWPTYRWPLNTIRWCIAHTWPTRWDGSRHPRRQALGRLAWSLSASCVGVAALLLASLLTVLAIPIWLAANVVGAGMIVLAGWSAPVRTVVDGLDAAWLEKWATSVDPDLVEPPVAPSTPRTAGWDAPGVAAERPTWNTADDPMLAAQRESTAELRRYNDLLEAQQRADQAAAALHDNGLARRAVRTRRWVWPILVASLLLAAGLLGGALMLSVAASWNADAVPPTFDEIETGIHQRTADRQARMAEEFEEQLSDGLGVDS